MQGIGLFETMRAYDGRIFRLQQHLGRLVDSARELGWMVMPDLDDSRRQRAASTVGQHRADTRVRLTLTNGLAARQGREYSRLTGRGHTSLLEKYPDECYTKGVTDVVVSDYRQSGHDPTAGHKTTSYLAAGLAPTGATRSAFEALWFTPDTNYLAEAAISSVFVVARRAVADAAARTHQCCRG